MRGLGGHNIHFTLFSISGDPVYCKAEIMSQIGAFLSSTKASIFPAFKNSFENNENMSEAQEQEWRRTEVIGFIRSSISMGNLESVINKKSSDKTE